MPLFRVTLILRQEQIGWTDEFYATSTDPATVARNAGVLAGLRMGVTTRDVLCTAIRISDDEVFRDSYVVPDFAPIPGTINDRVSNQSFAAARIRLQSGPLYRRFWDMGSLPTLYVSGNQFFADGMPFRAAFAPLQFELGSSGRWGMKVVNRTDNQLALVRSVSVAGVVVMAQDISGLAANGVVKIYWKRGLRPRGAPQYFNVVDFTDVRNFTVFPWNATWPTPYKMRRVLFSIRAFDNCTPMTIANHKRGRPLDLFRGRVSRAL